MASRLLAIFVLAAWCGLALGDLQTAGNPGDLTVYIGGEQSPSSGPGGFGLTSYDVPESTFASVNWGCNGAVRRIQVSGDSVWLAGDFTECDNARYGPLTRYDISSGTYHSVLPDGAYFTNAFDTIPNKWGRTISIRDVKLYKGKLYIAGLFAINFTATNEVAYNVAALDTRSGEWQLFGEGVNGRVNSIWVQDEQTFLLGGRFTRTGYKGTQDPTKVVFFRDPGFAVWHTDHPIYGTGYMSYTIGFQNNNFDKGFAHGWRNNMKENDYEVYAIWRGLLQIEPQGEILNPPVFTPEPERLTIVLAGSFPGGVIYQQDALPWHRANGGLWGGPVYTLEPCPEHNAFFFGGDFTHSGNENITLGTPQNAVTQWNYQNLWHQAGSVLPPHFDWLQGGVTGGPVHGLSWADDLGLLFVTGGFSAPYSRIAYFELDTQVWLPVGEGSEFSADLYSVALVSTGPHQDSWSGSWSSQLYPGNFYTCVLGNQFFGGFGFASFEGQLTADGLGVYGSFATAGASDAPNRGQFAFSLAADLLSFSGWYSLDGVQGRFPMSGSRIAFTTPDLITDCLATDDSAGGSAAGQWSLPDGTTLLDLCLVGVDSVTASSSQNAGRYYTGQAVFPGKIIQAQWYDATGYGMSLFLQATDDLMIEHWFSGDVTALDYTADCVLDLTCGVSVWSRTTGNATDADCAAQAAFGAWVGTWSGCGTIAGSEISLRPDGTGLVHGYFMGGLLEGRLVTPYRLEGYYSSAGFDAYVGAIRGPFAFEIDVGAPWDGRSFRGNFTMDVFANNQPLKHPYYFTCNSQRIRSLLPVASNTFLQLPSAGATVEGVWLKPDGKELAICVEEPGSPDAPTVVASTTSPTKRFYLGDAYTIKATGIEFFETYSASNVVGRDTASLNFWNADGSRGLALFRRVSATQLEESWFETGTARANRVSFVLNDCTAATCQFPDRGSNGALYTYSRPVTKDECQKYKGYQSQSPSNPSLALRPEAGTDRL